MNQDDISYCSVKSTPTRCAKENPLFCFYHSKPSTIGDRNLTILRSERHTLNRFDAFQLTAHDSTVLHFDIKDFWVLFYKNLTD